MVIFHSYVNVYQRVTLSPRCQKFSPRPTVPIFMGECQRSRSVGRELDGFAMVTKVGPNKILQGWNMTFSFPIILGILYFQLTNSYFSEG
jgi:hypothetical protein